MMSLWRVLLFFPLEPSTMESLKMAGATWFFARRFVQSILEYTKEDSNDPPPSGINLGKPLPKTLPAITEIKAKIPKHCFEATVPTSLYYAVKDVVLACITLAAILYVHQLPQAWLWWPALMVYWTIQVQRIEHVTLVAITGTTGTILETRF